MVKKIGKLVIGSILTAGVTGNLSTALNVPQGATMTSAMLEGTTKVIEPSMKIKGASMIMKSVGSLTKQSKKLKLKI
jgi:hypothetical protein